MSERYKKSEELLEQALQVIPLASQTFSKSKTQYPVGGAPLFLDRGLGGRVWDVDDNEYVDLVGGLMPVILGYCDPDVDRAIREQLKKGISFSLSTTLELELAERLVEVIPCAEMVRFGKNGSDATSGAIRLARGYTKRDRVAVSGYHGWQDWYIGSTTRKLGVPAAVSDLTHTFPYNDLDALRTLLKSHPGEFAAIIMEPMNVVEPYPGYLSEVKELAHKEGALFVLDEVITGFRYAVGGAQELFDVTPDLSSFGKSMGNGMPISAVVGRADIMALMEEVFFSTTFGGESLSLAAAIAVVDKMRREPVISTLWDRGKKIRDAAEKSIAAHGLGETVSFNGLAPWTLIQINAHATASHGAIKTFFIKEMLAQGVLLNASHNVCYSHGNSEVNQVAKIYDIVIEKMADALGRGALEQELGVRIIEPVFKVR